MKYAIVDVLGHIHVTSFSKFLLQRLYDSAYNCDKYKIAKA